MIRAPPPPCFNHGTEYYIIIIIIILCENLDVQYSCLKTLIKFNSYDPLKFISL